jgi:S-formylglutathione hydrolase FrmB
MGPWSRGGRCALATIAVLMLLPATASAIATPNFADGDGIHVNSVKALGPRLFALQLTTPLLTAPTNVRVLLPADYDQQAQQRYPVLYLFHGTSGGAADWTVKGRAEQTTAGQPLIVVMPDAGINSDGGSWFTDWVNGGKFGPPMWETFHIAHLIPWIDANLRTVAARQGRAIAGLSQGGFGAMSYAARHPDMFLAAASFSGALDIAANGAIADPLATPIINVTEVGLDGVPPNTFFGDRVTNEINWAAHDPATLAGNLRGMSLYAYTGNGSAGPFDGPLPDASSAIEAGVHELTQLFHGELVTRGIPIDYHDYGGGTHTWPYWTRDLHDMLPALMRDFADPPPAPTRIDFQSDAAHYAQWGWDVTLQRGVREFSTLQDAGAGGFTLAGSGSASVLTPALYAPGAKATVTVLSGSTDATSELTVPADGRLRLDVPLGPSNSAQQSTLGARTNVYSTRVRIEAPPAAAPRRVCASRRTVVIALRLPAGARVRSLEATAGRRVLHATRSNGRIRVSLSGLPRGSYRVRVVVKAQRRSGTPLTWRAERTLRTCGA